MAVIKKTLPLATHDGLSLDLDEARAFGAELHESYVNAEPFPHIAIDDFLPDDTIGTIRRNFPRAPVEGEVNFERSYTGLHKRQISPYGCAPELTQYFLFFNSAPVLQFLEQLTGIEGLISDPYFSGGGLHETRTGGRLGVHSDFKINKMMHLERRINVIVYLNEDWKEEYGGNLELWDDAMSACVHSIMPISNRCVIFNTSPVSNHGHPDPLTTPPDRTRKSLALYYYTASKQVYEDIGHNKTVYKARPGDSAKVKFQSKKREMRDRRKAWIASKLGFLSRLFKSN